MWLLFEVIFQSQFQTGIHSMSNCQLYFNMVAIATVFSDLDQKFFIFCISAAAKDNKVRTSDVRTVSCMLQFYFNHNPALNHK